MRLAHVSFWKTANKTSPSAARGILPAEAWSSRVPAAVMHCGYFNFNFRGMKHVPKVSLSHEGQVRCKVLDYVRRTVVTQLAVVQQELTCKDLTLSLSAVPSCSTRTIVSWFDCYAPVTPGKLSYENVRACRYSF